ncbi:MAG: RNA polymerase sigma factor [Mycobacterium leprae]
MGSASPALTPDEPALIAAAQKDPAAFGPLYERHVQQLYRYSLYRTGSVLEAEEVTAQTFVRALEYLPRYRWQGAPFVVWLYRIADSVMAKGRRRPRWACLPPDLAGAPPGLDLEDVELRQELLTQLYRLPEIQQQVLIQRFAQGLRYEEMAEATGRTAGALRQLAYRALQTLRGRMGRTR